MGLDAVCAEYGGEGCVCGFCHTVSDIGELLVRNHVLRGSVERTTVLFFLLISSFRALRRPQKKARRKPRTRTLAQAMTMPAMAPGLRLLLSLLLGGGCRAVPLGRVDDEGVSASEGKVSPGESW